MGDPIRNEGPTDDSANDRLESWKEIAGYLKRDVRTVQRWERLEKLPVHRHLHGKAGSVYAYRHEIDDWRDKRDANSVVEPPDPELISGDPPIRSFSGPGFRKAVIALASIAIFVVANISWQWISQAAEPKVVRNTALTSSGRADPWGGLTIDGSRVYFLERQGGHFQLMQTSVAGGEETPTAAPFPNTRIFELSPDGSRFLVGNFEKVGEPMPLSTWPAQGGASHRVGDTMVDSAVWFPDGKRILYAHDQGVFSVEADGTNARHLFDVSGSAGAFSWRPDGSVFRFTVFDGKGNFSLWQASLDAAPQPLLPGWGEPSEECCGVWTPDGRNYVFAAFQNGLEWGDLWVLPEPEGLIWRRKRSPVRLTNGPLGFTSPVVDKGGTRLFALGLQYGHSAFRFDPSHQTFVPFLNSKPVFDFAFSRDGGWVAYIGKQGALWRSRVDGTDALQLTSPPIRAMRPRWSPDGSDIIFMGYRAGTTSTPYKIPCNGGAFAPLVKEGTGNFAQADWSSDGNSVVFDAVSESGPQEGISVMDLRTHNLSLVPESKGKDYVRWSPDGRYLAARSEDEKELFLFDFHSQQWKRIAAAQYIRRHEWDANSHDLYFQDALSPAQTVFRVNVDSGEIKPVLDFTQLLQQGAVRCTFEGRSRDGSYFASVRNSVASVYALDVQLP